MLLHCFRPAVPGLERRDVPVAAVEEDPHDEEEEDAAGDAKRRHGHLTSRGRRALLLLLLLLQRRWRRGDSRRRHVQLFLLSYFRPCSTQARVCARSMSYPIPLTNVRPTVAAC